MITVLEGVLTNFVRRSKQDFVSIYVGQTNDLKNRIAEHNRGESSYTSTGIPCHRRPKPMATARTLLWSTTKASFRTAESLEDKLKTLSRARKIKFMFKHLDEVVAFNLLASFDLDI